MLTEPDVALTDYVLAIECAVFACLIYYKGEPGRRLRTWFGLFFGSIGLASFAGGTVHGFFLDQGTIGYAILWPATLITIGLTAFAVWAIGANLLFSPKIARRISAVAALEFVAYCLAVLLVTQEFWIAVGTYLPAVIFLLIVLLLLYRRTRDRDFRIGIMGLALTLLAAVIQQAGISLHPAYFNHNALYHVIQAAALFMIFRLSWFLTVTRKI